MKLRWKSGTCKDHNCQTCFRGGYHIGLWEYVAFAALVGAVTLMTTYL